MLAGVDMLKVLVWGHVEDGPCAYFRGHQFTEELKKHGVEYRGMNKVNFNVKPGGEKMLMPEAFSKGFIDFDTTDVDWADVIVFRRYYNTTLSCALDERCPFVTFSYEEAMKHEHGWKERDLITRLLWPAFEFAAHNKAIVYETDDDHFTIASWNGYSKDAIAELPLIESMARRADLVTTSTKVIADRYSKFNDNVRVIRNAVDPELYKTDTIRPDTKTRMVYYGSTARMRDYAGYPNYKRKNEGGYAAKAIGDFSKEIRKIFLGVNPGTEEYVMGYFDEGISYVEGIEKFCKTLADTHPDFGLAPLMGDEFDRAKSELHWLEYSMVGAAFIGERMRGADSPYAVVRDGVDGLLARGRQEWHDAVKKLVRNPGLREELAYNARERVLKEYHYKDRAKEWADAFKWAAENKGKGARIT